MSIVVVESRELVGLPEFEMLLAVLESPQLELLKEYPLVTHGEKFANITIRIFRYLDHKRPSGKGFGYTDATAPARFSFAFSELAL